jgi:putative nucleotidyltransferase with HDIG domain
MSDEKKEVSNDKDEKGSLRKRFEKNDLGLRLLVGFIGLLGVALFLHFKEARVELLELNTTASRYVVAQVDFEYPDDETTIILREKSISGIGQIYRVSHKQLQQVRFNFETFLLKDFSWRKRTSDKTFDEIYKTADVLEDILVEMRFTDARTLQKIKQLGLSTEEYVIISSPRDDVMPFLPKEFWQYLKKGQFSEVINNKLPDLSQTSFDYVLSYFEKQDWQLILDSSAQSELREAISKTVPQKYTRIKAGTKIIGQGEIVSQRHLAMMQSMKGTLRDVRNLLAPIKILGSFLMALIIIVLGALYFYIDQKEVLHSLQKLSLVICILILSMAFAKVVEYLLLQNPTKVIESIHFPLIIPFAALLFSILLNSRLSLFISTFLTIIFGVILAFDHGRFLMVNFVSGLLVIISTTTLRRRTEVFADCGKALLGTIPVFFAFSFLNNTLFSKALIVDVGSSIIFMLVIAILVVGLLPILESLFNVMTDITLMEYMDPNNELLRRLTLEIPGTYQHSLVVGNLAESSAQAIGANGLFCRVATLYHDIGKLNNTHYFTENQQSGVNIHQLLTPVESAQVIISHSRDGEILARKYRLPQSFIDVILEHHGTSLVYYFYRKEVDLKGGDVSAVDESLFRYPGPKPHSKESAIIMISDVTEAASRSLEKTTEESIAEMVDKVIADKAEDGQFDSCCLTFEELGIVKRVIVKSLMITQHVRIKYPEKLEKPKE